MNNLHDCWRDLNRYSLAEDSFDKLPYLAPKTGDFFKKYSR